MIPFLNTLNRIALVVFAILFLASCKSKQTVTKGDSLEDRVKAVNQRAFEEAFYEGNKQMVLGNHQEAIKKFKECISLNSKSSAALYLLAKEYSALRQFDQSIFYVRSAVKLDPNEIWYRLLLVEDLVHLNKNFDAGKDYESIADKFPNYDSYYFDAAEQYLIVNKAKDALRVLDKLEKRKGVNEEVSFKKEDIFIKINKKDAAIAELQKLIKTYPERKRYKVALAEIYYGFNEEAKAMDLLNASLKEDPLMPEAHMLLANIYRNRGEHDKSFEELKIVFANPEADVKQKLQVLSSYLPLLTTGKKMKDQAMTLGKLLTTAHPDEAACSMIYGDILYSSGYYPEAKTEYLKAIATNKGSATLWENLLICEDQMREYSVAIEHVNEALEAFPTKTIFYYYKAYFSFRLKDYEEALRSAKAGVDMGTDNAQLTIQILSILGDAGNALKNYAESDEAYEKILVIDPNNLQTLNNYAYYLSLRNDKLTRAEAMSKKTLELDPNNASYLDTYGWIRYKQGQFEDARVNIEKALTMQPDNAVLNEHLGDVYYRLHDIDKALKYWKLSKEKGNDSTALAQKINLKKMGEEE